jgi:hypothetical protein
MLDLHPVTEEQVEAGGRPIGIVEEPEYTTIHLPNAEKRVKEAVAAGLYSLEAETEFDFVRYFDDAAELVAAHEDPSIVKPELVERLSETTAPLALREHVVLRRFRVC